VKICPVCSTEYPDDVRFCPNDGQTLRASGAATNLVGQVVADRYHVIKKLGEGGMGQVYLAEHVKMGRRSAIKVMNPAMVHDPDAVARFNREASNASRITHPNVCAIYDFGETPDGLIYLAMEFIEGEPLTDLLEREGALPVPRAVSIFLQVAEALQAAHDLGIVHRDLKPDNVMLIRRRDGGDGVKVVDFGIAKAVGGDESGQKVTKTGLVVGTPEFMSPEQLSGDKVDGRSDLYSAALVLYQMLTGKLPFEASTLQETMIKRLTDEPTPLAQSRPDRTFPPGLQAVLDTALARTPVERYQTVGKLAADVGTATGVRAQAAAIPATRGGSDAKTQLLEAKKRSRVPVLVGVVGVVAAGGAGWALLNGGRGEGRQTIGPDSGAVSHDTAGNRTNPQTGDTARRNTGGRQTLANHDSGGRPRVDVARAGALLDDLFEKLDGKTLAATVVRDSAQHIYNAAGMARADQAFAAYVLANSFAQLDDEQPGRGHKSTALRWARQAAVLQPGTRSYDQLVHDLSQP
jgi:serine/threonine-protein kinase